MLKETFRVTSRREAYRGGEILKILVEIEKLRFHAANKHVNTGGPDLDFCFTLKN